MHSISNANQVNLYMMSPLWYGMILYYPRIWNILK